MQNFIRQSLNSGSPQVQILLAACRGSGMVRISDSGSGYRRLIGAQPYHNKRFSDNHHFHHQSQCSLEACFEPS